MDYEAKAKELVERFYNLEDDRMLHEGRFLDKHNAKQCALKAVDEILNNSVNIIDCAEDIISDEDYWHKVKEAIEVL